MTTETDKVIVKDVRDELARITAVIKANALSVDTKGVARELNMLADGIDDCVKDYVEGGALTLIEAQEERNAEPDDLPATSGMSEDERLDDPRRGLAEHINRQSYLDE